MDQGKQDIQHLPYAAYRPSQHWDGSDFTILRGLLLPEHAPLPPAAWGIVWKLEVVTRGLPTQRERGPTYHALSTNRNHAMPLLTSSHLEGWDGSHRQVSCTITSTNLWQGDYRHSKFAFHDRLSNASVRCTVFQNWEPSTTSLLQTARKDNINVCVNQNIKTLQKKVKTITEIVHHGSQG